MDQKEKQKKTTNSNLLKFEIDSEKYTGLNFDQRPIGKLLLNDKPKPNFQKIEKSNGKNKKFWHEHLISLTYYLNKKTLIKMVNNLMQDFKVEEVFDPEKNLGEIVE